MPTPSSPISSSLRVKQDLPVTSLRSTETLYVLPLNGAGLWNKIWGYIAIDAADHSTVDGADFGNAGETQVSVLKISATLLCPVQGKHIFREGAFTGIAVVKNGQKVEDKDYVDGISGGTLTSNGVNDMLATSLKPFKNFLKPITLSSHVSGIKKNKETLSGHSARITPSWCRCSVSAPRWL